MKNKKKIALSLAATLGCLAAHAAQGQSLYVHFSDGTQLEFALAEAPEVTFAADEMILTTAAETATFDLWQVASFTYGATTGISQATAGEGLTLEGDRLVAEGTAHQVIAYALDGKAVSLRPTLAGGKTIIPLRGLGRGTYIIKVNNKTIKIARP